MPTYAFRCPACRAVTESWFDVDDSRRHHPPTCSCGVPMKRVFSFKMAQVMHEHFNPTVGKPVSSMRQFKDELARASEEATARTGIPHNYQPADPKDTFVSDDGLRETHDRQIQLGLKEPSKKVL